MNNIEIINLVHLWMIDAFQVGDYQRAVNLRYDYIVLRCALATQS
jgi:hypothetical protein